jgi:DNA replication protein DnaC
MYQTATFTNWRSWGKHAEEQEKRKHHLVARMLIEIDRAPGAPRSPLLWIWRGGPGSGKTHMAWAGVRAARARDIWADLVPMGDLTRELRSTWGGGEGTTEEGVLEAARAPQLLVVDEVSEHALYARVHQHVYDIVDYRLQRLRPTILITNSDKLTELFGDAVLSRVEGYGGVIDFGNDDYRRQ